MKKAWLIPLTALALSVVGCKSVKETEPTWRHHLNEADRPSSKIVPSHTTGAFHYLYRDGEDMLYETYDSAGIVIGDGYIAHRTEAPHTFDPETGNSYEVVTSDSGVKFIKYNSDFSRAWETTLPDLAMLEGDYTPISYGFGPDGSMVALLLNRVLLTFNGRGELLGYTELDPGPGSPSLFGVNENNEIVVSAENIEVFNQELESLLSNHEIANYRTDQSAVTNELFMILKNYGITSYSLINGDEVWSTDSIGYIYDMVLNDGLYIVYQDQENSDLLKVAKYALDGSEVWRVGLPGRYEGSPKVQVSGGKVMVTYDELVSTIPILPGIAHTREKIALRAKLFDESGNELQSIIMDPMTTIYDCAGLFGCSADIIEGGTENLRYSVVSDGHVFILSEFDVAEDGEGNHGELNESHYDLSGYQGSSE